MSQESETIRAFIAIELPPEVKKHLLDVREKLSGGLSGARWVNSEGVHLTLKFLGAITPARAGEVRAALEPIAADTRKFPLATAAAGVFPHIRSARVLWIGMDDPSGLCAGLAARIDSALTPLGIEPEKRAFKPHLTLARFKTPERISQPILDTPLAQLQFEAGRVILFRSVLQRDGAVYTPISIFEFK